jgi:putative transposase
MWEGRFKSSLVDSEYYCMACYRYIELNPVRAKMVRQPGEYQWSSYRSNALGEYDPVVSPHKNWIGLGQNDRDRRKCYQALFDNDLSQDTEHMIQSSVRKGTPTGGDRFRQRIESALSIKLGTGHRGRPRKST